MGKVWENGFDLRNCPRTPAWFTCHAGYPDLLAVLVQAGADHNVRDGTGRTCAQAAARGSRPGHLAALRRLVQYGLSQGDLDRC